MNKLLNALWNAAKPTVSKYSFCESVRAGSLSPWHIRPLTPQGKKLGGGIDTHSLCGRVGPDVGGWDLDVEVEEYKNLDAETDGRRHICKPCVIALGKMESCNSLVLK